MRCLPFAYFLLLPLLLIFSCKKVTVTGPQGSQGPAGANGDPAAAAIGNIQGKVNTYDINGSPLTDNSGVTVSIDNLSPAVQSSTNANGNFILSSVHAGNYDLSLSKSGYGTMRAFNFAHTGSSVPTETGILETGQQMSANYDIRNLKVTVSSFGFYQFFIVTIQLAHKQQVQNPVLLYMNNVHGVDKSHAAYVFRSNFFQQDDSTLVYSPFDFQLSGFSNKLAVADSIYFAASIDNKKLFSYTDESGAIVYPCGGNLSNEAAALNVLKE